MPHVAVTYTMTAIVPVPPGYSTAPFLAYTAEVAQADEKIAALKRAMRQEGNAAAENIEGLCDMNVTATLTAEPA